MSSVKRKIGTTYTVNSALFPCIGYWREEYPGIAGRTMLKFCLYSHSRVERNGRANDYLQPFTDSAFSHIRAVALYYLAISL
jgi:hypothetical protein